jgi:predicted glycogen debranching enzyme
MQHSDALIQDPAPGSRAVFFCGDSIVFTLTVLGGLKGSAWIRTNIGHGATTRAEVIRSVHFHETPLGRDWFDTPMRPVAENRFEARLALCEVGHFEAKCFFLKQGEPSPLWPPGTNSAVNVEPAESCCANIVYNAFVRQFGPNKAGIQPLPPPGEACLQVLDAARYTVIPPSGTFRDLIKELDFIVGELGCRILMLLPIHPTPTTYGRMGRFGSPYAALSFRGVDPALAVFDPKATPMEQFFEIVDAVHRRNARIFLDIAINHTGWAANLHVNHPEWLVRSAEGRIEVPGAWGVQWEDLTKLDYRHEELWQFMAEVFLTWCRRGVDGFRCDAGYMVPHAAWRYIVARVRDQFPDTTFLLEGLGGKIEATRQLLNTANLNWAYSELFQNYDRGQIEHYLPEAIDIAATDGIPVHFAETHDNLRLAAKSATYARMRTALCALASHSGAFGFANGVEWLAAEKINVHDARPLNWGAAANQVAEIRRLAHLLKYHPAFHDRTDVKLIEVGTGNQIVILRHHRPSGKQLIIPVNLDHEQAATAAWAAGVSGLRQRTYTDLLTGQVVEAVEHGGLCTCHMEPGQVLCLSPDPHDMDFFSALPSNPFAVPPRIELQRLQAKALQVITFYRGSQDLAQIDVQTAAGQLQQNPVAFCTAQNPNGAESRVVMWRWPQDVRREVMIPPGHFLMVTSQCGFRARLVEKDRTLAVENSLSGGQDRHFCLFLPRATPKNLRPLSLQLAVHTENGTRREKAALLLLPCAEDAYVRRVFGRSEFLEEPMRFLSTNGRGAMLRAPVAWNSLASRYDALLAANFNPDVPEDRWILLTRCRAWLVYQGFSQDINLDCLQTFTLAGGKTAAWRYKIPSGQGQHVQLTVGMQMIPGRNALQIIFTRQRAGDDPARLADGTPVRLIVRPDIESRSFHDTTKAFTGPEHLFRSAIRAAANGFIFCPDAQHHLSVAASNGRYVPEAEWSYMVFRFQDAERGQDPHSDLFSPGYFEISLRGGETVSLNAEAGPAPAFPPAIEMPCGNPNANNHDSPVIKPIDLLRAALDDYVVERGNLKTVIAGYPWFLDWGRDSLIFVRGLIAAGQWETARAVLKLFGQYEDRGTLPNMIRGNDAGNRDTSDAPLWFVVACAELAAAEGHDGFLKSDCGGRRVRQVLGSIVRSYIAGVPNGVRMDPESGLIFSPSHFTWMDTNYPAGSPRQGYPVEIQVFWHATLVYMSLVDKKECRNWRSLAEQVRESLLRLFWQAELGCLSDCLHADLEQPARSARPDDAVRPNQLLAITLGVLDSADHVRRILAACEELLVPGAIRSLADRPVTHPLAIHHNGATLNDPFHPYWGTYSGDEDTRRKPAYHNGTAWTWLFPSYCEAWALAYGEAGRQTALAWLTSSIGLLESGCLGHLPEILDGDFPHPSRGCDAQAWGASEWVRVWLKLVRQP